MPAGLVLVLVVAMALGMFWAAEKIEEAFAPRPAGGEPVPARRGRRARVAAAAALAAAAIGVAALGQPSADQKWARAKAPLHEAVEARAIFASPAEIVGLKKDTAVSVELLDLRGEHDFNLFHAGGARRIEPAALEQGPELRRLLDKPASTVTFLAGNGEGAPLAAWKRLTALGVSNLYVVEGGMNRWLELYPVPACVAEPATADGPESLSWRFAFAAGASLPSAWPERPTSHEFRFPCSPALASGEPEHQGHGGFTWPAHPFTKRVKLQTKASVKGGCG